MKNHIYHSTLVKMTGMETNPYNSPSEAGGITEESLYPSRRAQAVAIGLAVASFLVMAPVGAAMMNYFQSLPPVVLEGALPLIYWMRWFNLVLGRLLGDFICGVLLGRYVNRTPARFVVLALGALYLIVLVTNRFFVDADSGQRLKNVGPVGIAAQHVVQTCTIFGTVGLGIWFGRRSRRRCPRALK